MQTTLISPKSNDQQSREKRVRDALRVRAVLLGISLFVSLYSVYLIVVEGKVLYGVAGIVMGLLAAAVHYFYRPLILQEKFNNVAWMMLGCVCCSY